MYQHCPKAESKRYVSVCVCVCVCVCVYQCVAVMKKSAGAHGFLWRPVTLFPNNALGWNRLFFHLLALCLAPTSILLPQVICLSLMPGYLARAPFLSCPCMGVASAFTWPAVLGVGAISESAPNRSPRAVTPSYRKWWLFPHYGIIWLIVLIFHFSFHSKTQSDIHILVFSLGKATKATTLLRQWNKNSGIKLREPGSRKTRTTD